MNLICIIAILVLGSAAVAFAEPQKDAFATVLLSLEYLQPVCVLGRSLDRHHHIDATMDQENHLVYSESADRVVLVEREILDKERRLVDTLVQCGWTKVISYERILNPSLDQEPGVFESYFMHCNGMHCSTRERIRISKMFDALHVFNLPYERVVYLDADMLVRRDISNLFDCVGSPTEIRNSLQPSNRFRLCAYQGALPNLDLYITPTELDDGFWEFESNFMVITPSKQLFSNMVGSLTQEDFSVNQFLGRYFFWTCARGMPLLATETERQASHYFSLLSAGKQILALPRMWLTGGWEGDENTESPENSGDRLQSKLSQLGDDYERWPMYECKRIEERYNMRITREMHDLPISPYKDIRVVYFDSVSWKPFYWYLSLFSGFFEEYRFYANLSSPAGAILCCALIAAMMTIYNHPGVASYRIVRERTVTNVLIYNFLCVIPNAFSPVLFFSPLIPRFLDAQLGMALYIVFLTGTSLLFAYVLIKNCLNLESDKRTAVLFHILWAYLFCACLFPLVILAVSVCNLGPSTIMTVAALLSVSLGHAFNMAIIGPIIWPLLPVTRD